jgi:hypothetical protein
VSCFSRSFWREVTAPRDADERFARATLEYDEASHTLWIRGGLEMGTAEDFHKALLAHPEGARCIGRARAASVRNAIHEHLDA